MAAPIVTAGTSAEAQLLEIATALNEMERLQSTPEAPKNNVSIDPDLEGGTVNISVSIPVTVTATANGFAINASTYLT